MPRHPILIAVASTIVVCLASGALSGTDPSQAWGWAPNIDIRSDALWMSYSSRCPPWNRWPSSMNKETALRRGFACRREKLDLAREAGDEKAEVLLLKEIALGHRQEDACRNRDCPTAIDVIDQALDIVEEFDEPCWESYLQRIKAGFFHKRSDQKETTEVAVRIAAAGFGCEQERALALANLGSISYGDESLKYYEEALEWARRSGDPGTMVHILHNTSQIYRRSHDPRTIPYLIEIVRICERIGDRKSEMGAIWTLGVEYEKQGQVDRAIPLYQEYVDYCTELDRCSNDEPAHLKWLLDQQEQPNPAIPGDATRASAGRVP